MEESHSFTRLQAAWAVLKARHDDDDSDNAIDDMMLAWPVDVAHACKPQDGGSTSSAVALTPFQSGVLPTDSVQRILDIILEQNLDWPQNVISAADSPPQGQHSEANKNRTLLVSPNLPQGHHDGFEPYGLFVRLEMDDPSEAIRVRVDFKPGMGSETQAKSIARQLHHVLHQLASVDPSTSIEQLDMVPPKDLRHIWELNSDVSTTISKTVPSMLAKHFEERPDAPAICAWDGELSYGQLDFLANRLSQYLIQQGVKPGVTVPICFERSLWAPVAMLAVIRAGGAGLTIDVTQPEERLQANVSQILPTPVVLSSMTCGEFALRLAPDAKNFRVSQETIESLPELKISPKLPELSPSDPICIVFTSGSTGKPKGITLTHTNFSSALFHQSERILIHANSRVYYFASFAFDAAWHNLLHTLYNGACLCVPSESERKNDVSGSICRYRATWADLTPRLGELLEDRALTCLQLLQLAGERPNPTVIDRIRKLVPVRFAYGPAECAVMSTISSDDAHFTSVGSGCGLRTWIVYPDGSRLMPVGSVGELWLEGPLVGKGYMHDPQKTASAFVQDPPWLLNGSPEVPGRRGRLYRTGDLVRYDGGKDGGLTFIGRKDGQVKIRGQRVELAEVDHHIWQQLQGQKAVLQRADKDSPKVSNVRVAAEVVKFSSSDRALLVAFICLTDTAPSSLDKVAVAAPQDDIAITVRKLTQDLDERLSAIMPSYMVPSAFIPVTAIPVTPTCKSDRRRLRQLASGMTMDQVAALNDRKQDRIAPSTPQEKKLQKLWSKVMGIDAEIISAEDNFYRIGGDSIVAMRLIGLARKEGISLTVAKILRHPRLSDLAKTLPKTTQASSDDTIPPFAQLGGPLDREVVCTEVAKACDVPRTAVQDVLPCSPLQEGLLALTSSRGDYITRHMFRLLPGTDLKRFQQAWATVISSNAILRTRIVDLPGYGLMQVVLDCAPDWQVTKGSSRSKAAPQRISMGLGTCLSVFTLDHEGDQIYLTWTAHHALFDAWSIGVIFDAVSRAYNKAPAVQTDPFAKFVRAIRACKEKDATDYWSKQFSGSTAAPFPSLPSETYRPRADTVVSATMDNFNWLDDQHTIATAAKASWAIVQANLTGGEDVLFGSTLTGRQFPVSGIERIVGPTIATVPLRILVDQTRTVHDLLASIQSQGIDMIAHEQAGMQRIRRIAKDVDASCDFQTILVVQPKQMALHNERGLLHDQIEGDILKDDKALNSVNSYALMVQFELDSTSARIRLSFDSSVVGEDQAHQIAQQLKQTFRQLCAKSNQSKSIQDLELVPPADLDVLWRRNALVPPSAKTTAGCVHDLIAITAQKLPEAPAVAAWDGNLSYRELDTLSSQLARHLVQEGIEAGAVVPLFFEKSVWTPVAQLAVMKAGGACLVLDVDQPEERLRTLIDQTCPTMVLASSASTQLSSHISSATCFTVGKAQLQGLPENVAVGLPSVSQSQLAYVVFTSGSTGVPKGAMVTHANAMSAIALQTDQLKFKPSSRVLDFTSYAFDVTWSNFIHALGVGACLCIPSNYDRLNSLTRCIQSLGANYVHIIPSISHLLDYSQLEQLETLHFSGESLPASIVDTIPRGIHVINSYGPAECTVTATMKDIGMARFQEVNIGQPLGALAWIVRADAKDLVPLGAVGELWLEGPLVGQGYLRDPEKTSTSFVQDPVWLSRGSRTYSGRRGRLYRTGDIVRQESDGNIVFISRKDGQVKINGQRVELGEVEQNIRQHLPKTDSMIEHVRLIAEVARFSNSERSTLVVFVCPWTSATTERNKDAARTAVQRLVLGLNERLEEYVPKYMVPNAYIALDSIPMTATGKTDRRRLRQIAAEMESGNAIRSDSGAEGIVTAPSSPVEHALRELWSAILGSPADSISTTESFTRLGGDSITAMQLVSRARNHPLKISTRTVDILRLQTIEKIAKACKLNYNPTHATFDAGDERPGEKWVLSPIQSHFFRVNQSGESHWNQSFALRLKDPSKTPKLKTAIEAVVQRHQILKARFSRDKSSVWQQHIANDHELSFMSHRVDSSAQMRHLTKLRHEGFDIETGPVFAADVFSMADEKTVILVLSAHHLVIDIVSWRIIWDDVERNLRGQLAMPPAISFRHWCKLQQRDLQTTKDNPLLSFEVREPNLGYWGISPADNTSDNFEIREFSLDRVATSQLLGPSNNPYRTEPTDIFIAVLIQTFQATFSNRHAPPIWVERHGREALAGHDVDLSETVGWFTTLHPVQLSDETNESSELCHILRETKDVQRWIQPHSRQYFASRQFHEQQLKSNTQGLFEVLLNFIGRSDQMDNNDSLFASVDDKMAIDIEQVGPRARRLSMVELVIGIRDDRLQIRFAFNTRAKQQYQLRQWMERYVADLNKFGSQLCEAQSEPTWSDFPLLKSTSYKDLDSLVTEVAKLGHAIGNVRDIYPCTPLQEGILLSKTRGAASYANHWIWTCQLKRNGKADDKMLVSIDALQQAWQKVILHHSIFATVFVEDPKTGKMLQLVLQDIECRINRVGADRLSPGEALLNLRAPVFPPGTPEYQVTICEGASENGNRNIACRLDMSHALTDAASTSIIVHDLQKAYNEQLSSFGSRFSDVIRAIQTTPELERQRYWVNFLHGVQPCHIRSDVLQVESKDVAPGAHNVFAIPVPRAEEIFKFCRKKNMTQSTFLQVSWALVLYSYTGIDRPCFGFLSSGRDVPVDGVDEIVGPLINMLASRVSLGKSLDDIFASTSSQLIDHLDHQHMSLAKVQHELGLRGKNLFNTSVTVRNASFSVQSSSDGLNLASYHSEDLHEFDVTLAAEVSGPLMNLLLTCRRDRISKVLSWEIKSTFEAAVSFMLSHGDLDDALDQPQAPTAINGHTGESFFQDRTKGVREEEARTYWVDMLAGVSGAKFPIKSASLPSSQRQCMKMQSKIPAMASHTHRLETLVRATWAVLQAQYSNDDDVVYGMAATRGEAGLTIAPVRMIIDRTESVKALLDNTQTQIITGNRFGSTGLHWICQASDDSSIACEFQTLLTTDPHISPDVWEAVSQTYPLVLQVSEEEQSSQGQLLVQIGFCPSVLNEEQVQSISRQFCHVLNQLCETSASKTGRQVGDLDLVSPEDLNTIWERNAQIVPAVEECVHDIFAKTVKRLPEALAVCAWDGDLCYNELDQLSTRLAHRLVDLGVKPGVIVPICFEKSLWTPVAKLATIKAGGACLALDVNQPEERLRSIVRQVSPTIILASVSCTDLAKRLYSGRRSVPIIVTGRALIDSLPTETPQSLPAVLPSALLYVVFTSGSTGTPKAVMVTHQNFCSAVQNQQEQLGFFQGARVFDFVSYAFDVSWSNLLHSMTVGACLCIPSEDDRIHNTLAVMNRLKVSYANVTPSMERRLELWRVASLKVLLLSGEPLENFDRGAYPQSMVIKNTYGPSECTVKATIELVTASARRNGSIGRAIGCNAWVVHTDTDKLVPPGSIGELWLEGPQVGNGYLSDESKTASAFVQDPPWLACGSKNGKIPGRTGRLYRTGDLVCQEFNGTLTFMGRRDGQVKLRGQRVELGEVEYHVRQQLSNDPAASAALRTANLKADVVTLADTHQPSLVIFIQLLSMTAADVEAHSSEVRSLAGQLNEHLGKVIPTYMVPRAYIPISSLPMTATGKLDRRRLARIASGIKIGDVTAGHGSATISQPESIEERIIRDAWASALEVPPSSVPVTESFTRLGGDSIMAMQVVASCREHQIPIRTVDVLRSQSIQEIAQSLVKAASKGSQGDDPVKADLPLRQWYEGICEFQSCSPRNPDRQYWGIDSEYASINAARWRKSSRYLDAATTTQLVGDSNIAYRTEWWDIMVAVLYHSFRTTFSDYKIPTIFLELGDSLTREKPKTSAASTSILPAHLPDSISQDIVTMVRHAKDARCQLQRDGVVYRCKNQKIRGQNQDTMPMNSDDLIEIILSCDAGNVGNMVQMDQARAALFQITAGFDGEQISVSFTVDNRIQQHRERIEQWFDYFMESVRNTVTQLSGRSPGVTLGDFPLLKMSYQGLDALVESVKESVALGDVRDIYPCTPLQEGVLLSRKLGTASYANHWSWTCRTRHNGVLVPLPISTDMLRRAWKSVIARHSVFSTIFIDDPETGSILQLLRTDQQPQISYLHSGSIPAGEALQQRHVPSYRSGQPEYMVSICEDSAGRVACRLDMSHSLSDASSIPILIRDLKKAYDACRVDQLPTLPAAPLFSDVIRTIEQTSASERQSYWEHFLKDVQTCCIPTDFARSTETKIQAHHVILISTARTDQLLNFCKERGITQSTFLHVVWALVLNACTGLDEPCFGFLSSGRDLALDQVGEICGPLINILASRISLKDRESLDEILSATSKDLIEHLDHQHMSLARIHHHLGLHGGQQLFNTSITVRNASFRLKESTDGLDLREHHNEDPHEFDMTLAAEISGTALELALTCRRDTISTATAFEMKSLFEAALSFILDSGAAPHTNAAGGTGALFFEARLGFDLTTASSYWSRIFEGLAIQTFPSTETVNRLCRVNSTVSEDIESAVYSQAPHDVSVLLQASWALAQAEYTNEDDILSGMTIPGTQAAVMPARTVIDRTETVQSFLGRLQQQKTEARPFEQTGLHYIRRVSEHAARACQFRTLLFDPEVERRHGDTLPLDDYALVVRMNREDPESTTIEVGFDSRVMVEEVVCGLNRLLVRTMQQLCAPSNQSVPLNALNLLPSDDAKTIWNLNDTVPGVTNACLHDIIASTTKHQPQAPAINAWDGQLTYGELEALSTGLASHLVKLGVGPGVIVPLCFEKCMLTPVAMLAVMKAGGASVVLDCTQPPERLRTIIQQVSLADKTSLRVVLSSTGCFKLAQQISPVHIETVNLRSLDAFTTSHSQSKLASLPLVSPTDLLYVVFTSGSTGLPKGATVSHANASSAITLQKNSLRFKATSRVLDSVSYAFDVTWSNFLYTLCVGGCLCVPREEDRINNLNQCIRDLQVNYLHITPSVGQLLDFSHLEGLQTLSFIGEPLQSRIVDQIPQHVHVLNTYGPAECTVTATISDIGTARNRDISIGKAIGGNAWVVRNDRLVPIGSIGELWLEGPHVGAGYLGDVVKTAAAFVQDPEWLRVGVPGLSAGRQGRLYRTGDLVRQKHDGSLVYIGRSDGQVKIRGQRLELGEVEYNVRKHLSGALHSESLQMAAEVVTFQGSQQPSLVVFLCLPAGNVSRIAQLTDGLNERLAKAVPTYMIPSTYIPIEDGLPMTATGKTDRLGLRKLASSLSSAQLTELNGSQRDRRREPTTEREKVMQLLWATVLGIDPATIGADDSFFHAGGDSIVAMRLVGAARRQGLTFTVSDILQQPRLSDLARITSIVTPHSRPIQTIQPFSLLEQDGFDQELARARVAKICGVAKSLVQDILPCTPLQQGLLALTADREGDYVGQHVFKLHPTTDLDRLKKAWQTVVTNTPILRTRIVDLPGQGLVQIVLDCSAAFRSGATLGQELAIGLGTPLSYFTVNSDSEQGCQYFTWTIHHALYDAWSMALIFDALVQAYNGNGAANLQHEPFSRFVKATVVDTDKDKAAAFWTAQFKDLAAVSFPDNGPLTSRACADSVILEPMQGDLLWKDNQYTLATAIRAAWTICQSVYTDNEDVVFGTTVTGRQAAVPGIDQIVGPTIAAVPVRLTINPSSTVRDLLQRVHDQAIQMIPYEQSGLAQIRQINSDAERACQFQTLLVVQPESAPGKEKELFDQQSSGDRVRAFTSYPLMIQVELQGTSAQLRLSFDSKILSEKMARSVARQLCHTIQQVCIASHQTTIADLESIPTQDLDSMWKRNAQVPTTIESAVHELLAKTLLGQPKAPAVCAWDGNLSYGELDSLSTRLARHLLSLGLSDPDAVVPLCFEKSMWTPVSMLAIVKAGSASVVLDVNQPEQRLRTVVQTVSTSVMLCSASQKGLAARLTSRKMPILAIDQDFFEELPEISSAILPTVLPSQRLCVIFTSGSTGKPKGIEIEHRNFSSAMVHQQEKLGLNAQSRLFSFASHSFDATWHNLLHTLWNGACLCIPSESERRNDLSGSIIRYKATFADLTPTVAQTLNSTALRTLKSMILVGEAADMRVVNRIRQSTEARFVYGPAECSVMTTISDPDARPSNIGHQFGLTTWIAREDGTQLVPFGAIGELWIEGPLVGRGYLADEERTRSSFIENPPWLLRGSDSVRGRHGRLYRTGDLVRREEDGSLTFIGRKDAQIKLRGQRVELGEVEHHVLQHLRLASSDGETVTVSVAAEVVTLCNSKRPTLVVFVCPSGAARSSGTGPDAAAAVRSEIQRTTTGINERIAETLPIYMVPSAYIPLLQIPMTATGKTDRRRLRDLASTMSLEDLAGFSGASDAQDRTSPSTQSEVRLQELWSMVLDVNKDDIHAEDTFFRLGGDSISAMRLVEAARISGLSLTVSNIMQNPRLSKLAPLLQPISTSTIDIIEPFSLLTEDEQQAVMSKHSECFGDAASVPADAYPTSFVQRYYIEDSSETSFGVHFLLIDLPQDVDLARLEEGCRRAVKHFDILRTVFTAPLGRTLQIVLKDLNVPFRRLRNVDDLDGSTQQLCRQHQMSTLYDKIIPCFFLVQDCAHRARLVMRISHAQYDGFTLPAILSALGQFYNEGDVATPPPFASVIHSFISTNTNSLPYWNSLLRGSVMSFPAKPPSNSLALSHAVITTTRTISAGALKKLQDVTPAHYFTAACAVMLARLTGSKDVLFGRLVSGRAGLPANLTNASGPCINTVPVRAIFRDDTRVSQVLAQVVQQYVEGIAHEQVGFDDLKDKCASWPESVQNFGVVTKYQNIDETPPLKIGQFEPKSRFWEGDMKQTRFNMVRISGYPEGEKLRLVVAANSAQCSQESLEGIVSGLADALSG